MGEKSCCCCFSVKTGAFIIGAFQVLGLLGELEDFNMLRCIIKLVCVAIFGAMIFADSKTTRMWFFIAFVLNPFAQMLAASIDKPQDQEQFENAASSFNFKTAAE